MPISNDDLSVHFTSTLMALIRTALEIKLASGEVGVKQPGSFAMFMFWRLGVRQCLHPNAQKQNLNFELRF